VVGQLLEQFLRLLLIVPKSAGGGELFELFYFVFAPRKVKATSANRRASVSAPRFHAAILQVSWYLFLMMNDE